MNPRRIGWLSLGALSFVLSACAAGPAYPLMTPIQVAHNFGYDQRPAEGGNNRYEVTYLTPPADAYGYRFDLRPAEGQAKDMASDLAMLHAARLAQASGWQGFEVNDRHSSTDAESYGPNWDGWGPGWHGGGWHHHGFWGDDDYLPPRNILQAEVSLSITFTNTIKPGDYRAADVIQQVTKTYPEAEGPAGTMPPAPPVAPASAAPKPTA